MTTQEKIKNIMTGVNMAIDQMREEGTLTTEMYADIINNMNQSILAVMNAEQ